MEQEHAQLRHSLLTDVLRAFKLYNEGSEPSKPGISVSISGFVGNEKELAAQIAAAVREADAEPKPPDQAVAVIDEMWRQFGRDQGMVKRNAIPLVHAYGDRQWNAALDAAESALRLQRESCGFASVDEREIAAIRGRKREVKE